MSTKDITQLLDLELDDAIPVMPMNRQARMQQLPMKARAVDKICWKRQRKQRHQWRNRTGE